MTNYSSARGVAIAIAVWTGHKVPIVIRMAVTTTMVRAKSHPRITRVSSPAPGPRPRRVAAPSPARLQAGIALRLSGISRNSMARMLLPIGRMPHMSPCHVRRHLGCVDGSGGWDIILAPDADGAILESVHFAPAGKNHERLVVRVAHKNPFQSVAVGVMKHRGQRIETRLPEIFGSWSENRRRARSVRATCGLSSIRHPRCWRRSKPPGARSCCRIRA